MRPPRCTWPAIPSRTPRASPPACSARWPTCARSPSSGTARAPRPSCACASRWRPRSWPPRDAARLEALTSSGLLGEIASELNVKTVTTTTDLDSLVEQQVVPNFRALGPRLGAKVQEVRARARRGRLRARRRRRRARRGRAARGRRVRAALARARGLRGPDRRHARRRDRHARDRRARARGHRARRRALPPERAQGARLRRLRSHRRALRRQRAGCRGARRRTAPRSRARCWRSASSRATAASTGSPRAAPRSRSRSRARERARARAVVFDCDGLLIDSEVRWAVAERRVVEQHGGVWSEELRESLVGGSGENTARAHRRVGRPAGVGRGRHPGRGLRQLPRGDRRAGRRAHARRAQPRGGAGRAACRWPWRPTRASTSVRATLAASGLPPVFEHVFTPVGGAPAEARARRLPGRLRRPRSARVRGRRVRGLAARDGRRRARRACT